MAVTAAVLAVLTIAVGGAVVASNQVANGPRADDSLVAMTLVIFAVVAVAYSVVIGRPRLSLGIGLLGCATAMVVLARVSIDWAPTLADAVPLLVQLAVLSAVTGGSLAAIVLGYWYLVTPKISERPLLLQTRLLFASLIVQALLFVTWTTLGGGPGQTGFEAFTTGPVLLVALRLIVTIAFPIVLVWMASRTAQTRSMESATGLLYINFAAVMAGTIGAAALYVSSGILV